MIPWHDGFVPSGCNNADCFIKSNQVRCLGNDTVLVLDDILSEQLANELYRLTVNEGVWGTYVAMKSIQDNALVKDGTASSLKDDLAIRACRAYFMERLGHLLRPEMDQKVHGIAVWGISSVKGQAVEYHVDYAEMHRYRTNVIYPPLYGATLHVTKAKVSGGDLHVNKLGLEHYRKVGYKQKLGQINDLHTQDWVKVDYKFNRGILCGGDLPHLSSTVEDVGDGMSRVIIGFNLFDHEVGPMAQQYPEHSAKFNKFVKLNQGVKSLRLEDCQRNPKLARLLVYLLRKKKELEHKTTE